MKEKIQLLYNHIVDQTEEWTRAELERLYLELEGHIDIVGDETCEHCGNRPSTGACFHCKMD